MRAMNYSATRTKRNCEITLAKIKEVVARIVSSEGIEPMIAYNKEEEEEIRREFANNPNKKIILIKWFS